MNGIMLFSVTFSLEAFTALVALQRASVIMTDFMTDKEGFVPETMTTFLALKRHFVAMNMHMLR